MGSGLIEAINCIMVSLYRKRTVKYMMQSMSRVAHCIDNGLMEGFWGILKRERYYGKVYFQAEACPNGSGLYLLLQYPTREA